MHLHNLWYTLPLKIIERPLMRASFMQFNYKLQLFPTRGSCNVGRPRGLKEYENITTYISVENTPE
jgi:hypothetical protein